MALTPEMQRIVAEAKARVAAQQAQKLGGQRIPDTGPVAAQSTSHASPIPVAQSHLANIPASVSSVASAVQEISEDKALSLMDKALAAPIHVLPTTFNEEQTEAITIAKQGRSFCLIGAAGTGKTTVTQKIIMDLQTCGHVVPFASNTDYLTAGAPAIVILGYTNKAVNNIRKKLPPHIAKHCLTFHKVLQFKPEYFEVPDAEGGMKNTMEFVPTFHAQNKLPHISVVISEESSMTGIDLWGQLIAALPNPSQTQFVMLGDLNQIPPVFGPSILGFKLLEYPIVELKQVYRQALQSPIIALATAIRTNNRLSGSTEDLTRLIVKLDQPVTVDHGEEGVVSLRPWKQRVEWETALHQMKRFLPGLIDSGQFDPDHDVILCPFNKSFGTVELNRIIADHLTKKRDELTYEIRARFEVLYLAVGDRVLHDRHDAVITKIYETPGYAGKPVRKPSKTMNRWGRDKEQPSEESTGRTADEMFAALESMAFADEDSKNKASHTVEVYIPDLDRKEVLNSAGALNKLLLSYALTVHKSQGSEWRRVFILLHNSHAKGTLLSRELLYTAVTRAKKELHIICEGDSKKGQLIYKNSIIKAADSPVIRGTTLREKAEYFRGKMGAYQEMMADNE